ncbi:cysteine-rich venom protein kaouthin-1 [Brachyhypopomus gauderio]|uniref:cysteine-rich venom protein kaouthin-1 n=1 Tax=Brachyhypopomus gauderio TaxID=698409 RepID=UPI0040417B6C
MLEMKWSNTLAASAQAWTDSCTMNHGPVSSRMVNGYQVGENLFKSTDKASWTSVVTAWHSEVVDFKYPLTSKKDSQTGHYTQVVWYSSYQVGCGVTDCGEFLFYACHYYRAGNFKSIPPYTKGTPCSACPHACSDKLCTNPCPYINKYLICDWLKNKGTCANYFVLKNCPALCKCDGKIIPVGRK